MINNNTGINQFIEPIKEVLEDPVTYENFKDPVTLNCGHSLEKSIVQDLFRQKNPCPLCRVEITHYSDTNFALKNLTELVSRSDEFVSKIENTFKETISENERLKQENENLRLQLKNNQNSINDLKLKNKQTTEALNKCFIENEENKKLSLEKDRQIEFLKCDENHRKELNQKYRDLLWELNEAKAQNQQFFDGNLNLHKENEELKQRMLNIMESNSKTIEKITEESNNLLKEYAYVAVSSLKESENKKSFNSPRKTNGKNQNNTNAPESLNKNFKNPYGIYKNLRQKKESDPLKSESKNQLKENDSIGSTEKLQQPSHHSITLYYPKATKDDSLFIRGTGPGMSWEKGIKLEPLGDGYFLYKTNGEETPFEFKVLLHDILWYEGENLKFEGKDIKQTIMW